MRRGIVKALFSTFKIRCRTTSIKAELFDRNERRCVEGKIGAFEYKGVLTYYFVTIRMKNYVVCLLRDMCRVFGRGGTSPASLLASIPFGRSRRSIASWSQAIISSFQISTGIRTVHALRLCRLGVPALPAAR